MKITRTVVEEFEVDLDSERKRINEIFKGEKRQRQLDILDAVFVEHDLEKAEDLIDKLPYDEKEGCWENEFIGLWAGIFGLTSAWNKPPIALQKKYEFNEKILLEGEILNKNLAKNKSRMSLYCLDR